MANLQNTLDALQPYVIGIRYLEGVPVIDVVFKPNWTLPESDTIKKVRGNDELNYYMLFSEVKGVGLDELLEFVDKTIKLNLERENKLEFLKLKVNELKELFKKHSLAKLKGLKFVITEDEPQFDEFELEEVIESHPSSESIQPQQNVVEVKTEILTEGLTEDEIEIIEEEKRAENFKRVKNTENWSSKMKQINSIELPPKPEPVFAEYSDSECSCDENSACSKCIDRKGY